jgi:ferredoxin
MTQNVTITFSKPGTDAPDRSIDTTPGTSILDAALDAGIEIEATCGRRGKCRSCRVKVLSGDIPPATAQDTIQLGHDAVTERFRLACQTSAIADCTVMAAPPKTEIGHQILAGGGRAEFGESQLDSGVDKYWVQAEAVWSKNSKVLNYRGLRTGRARLNCPVGGF